MSAGRAAALAALAVAGVTLTLRALSGVRPAAATGGAPPPGSAAPTSAAPPRQPERFAASCPEPLASDQMDRYGGVRELRAADGADTRFRVAKFGNRWLFVTPAGHGFFLRGVYALTGDSGTNPWGQSYNEVFNRKWGSAEAGWHAALERIVSWGFNAAGPYSYRMAYPTDSDNRLPLPFAAVGPNPAITGSTKVMGAKGAYRNLYEGLAGGPHDGYRGGNFPDVFDPAWEANTRKLYATDTNLALYKNHPMFLGYFSDDGDYVNGVAGAGTDFPTDPPGKYHWHLGYLALVTSDEMHTRRKLRDFLGPARFAQLAALPPVDPHTLAGFPADGRADLDRFLYELARQFFRVNREAFKAVAPKALFFGPTTIGGWSSPARAPIIKAAGESLDVVFTQIDIRHAGQVEFLVRHLGDVPFALWEGVVANPDSPYHAHVAPRTAQTQEERGEAFRMHLEHMVAIPECVGFLFWSWVDHRGERLNWGLVTQRDNAYDGREATRAHGEERDYGDFLATARAANLCVLPAITARLRRRDAPRP